jgi:hypothetical protein
MRLDVDKHLKIDEPLETIYLSHKPHPIKVVDTALSEITKADEIVSEMAKTRKGTAVVGVMSIFKKKDEKCRALILEMRSLLAKRRKEPIFWRKNLRIKKPFSKIKKRLDTEEISA